MSKQSNSIIHPINVRSYLEEKCSDLISQYEIGYDEGNGFGYIQKSHANIGLLIELPSILPTNQKSVLSFQQYEQHNLELWALGANNLKEANQYMQQRGYAYERFECDLGGSLDYEFPARTIDDIKGVITLANDVLKYLNKE